MTSGESGTTTTPEVPRLTRIWIAAAAVVIVVLLVLVSLFAVIPIANHLVFGGTQVNCLAGSGSATPVSAPVPDYDVQEVMAFTQSYSQLEFNVTAVAQCDTNGYGPAYLLNGLTNTGYWYQVGLNWDWPLQNGGYIPGFGFVSEDWAPGGLSRSPSSVPFTGTVNQNDTVELSLTFTGGRVVASAHDIDTNANASTNFSANGGTTFVGSQAQQSHLRFSFATRGYFTGLMTEWYHVDLSANGPEHEVVYSENISPVTSATIGIGEWDFATLSPVSVFSSVANGGNPIDFSTLPNQLQQFSYNGLVISADAFEFVTGPSPSG